MATEIRSKWDILLNKRSNLEYELALLNRDIAWLMTTPCTVDQCGTCGAKFETEADFAKHYTVPDRRYWNLGHCPTKDGK